jgi:hypothetical protein
VKQWLETKIRRPVNLHVMAHSGAVIGFAENPADERTGTPGEVPNSFPTIAYQASNLLRARLPREDVDLVLMDGCINDTNVRRILTLDPTVGPNWVANLTRAKCYDDVKGLLSLAIEEQWFPNARIVVTGYFGIVSHLSSLPSVLPFLAALGVLPPLPLPDVPGWHELISLTKLASQSAAFYGQSERGLKQAVDEVNAAYGGNRALFVSVPFGPQNAYGAPDSWLFQVGQKDEVWDERQRLCPRLDPCTGASMGHPNMRGAQVYADEITKALEPFVPVWQAQGGTLGPVSVTPHPPIYIKPEYAARTPHQATMSVYAADWATGAAIPGRVLLDHIDTGALGQAITLKLKAESPGQARNSRYGGLVPPTGLLKVMSSNGEQTLPFDIRPPTLKINIKVARAGANVDSDDPETATRKATVYATDAATGQSVGGTVIVNGKSVGQISELLTFACMEAEPEKISAVDTTTDGDTTPTGKPKIPKRQRPDPKTNTGCQGVVQIAGYQDAFFRM